MKLTRLGPEKVMKCETVPLMKLTRMGPEKSVQCESGLNLVFFLHYYRKSSTVIFLIIDTYISKGWYIKGSGYRQSLLKVDR